MPQTTLLAPGMTDFFFSPGPGLWLLVAGSNHEKALDS